MTDKEVLINYRDIQLELDAIEKHMRKFSAGGPKGVRGVQLTGMPRGTNDPVAAEIQRGDYDKIIEALEKKSAERLALLARFEDVMDRITDRRACSIVRYYYAVGMTDAEIGETMELNRSVVNEIRNKTVDAL